MTDKIVAMGDPLDRALGDLDDSWNEQPAPAAEDPVANNDRTILGVGTPRPISVAPAPGPVAVSDPLALLQARARRPTNEPPALAHSEQSPLAFVMRAGEASPAPQERSHDMSMFVEGLVAETSPVVAAEPVGAVMEPVMRRSRKRRNWIVASAIAATAILGAAVGVHLAAKQDAPKIAANQMPAAPPSPAPTIVQPPPPPPSAATTPPAPVATPTVDSVAAAPTGDPAPPVTEVAAPSAAVAKVAAPTPSTTKVATKTSTKKVASKKVATATTTAKKPTTKSSSKSAIAKKTTARKSTSAKKTKSTKKTHR